jgi:hypothetical protein
MTEPTLQTIDVDGLRMAWGPLQISAAVRLPSRRHYQADYSPTNFGDAGAKFNAFAMRTQVAF